MIKRIISIAIVLMLCLQSVSFAAFNDVDGNSDYAKSAERLNSLRILQGKGSSNFDPDGYVTRAEMAKIAAVVSDIEVQDSEASLFLDLEEGNWANGYVNSVAMKGIISGYPDGTFRPDNNLTYAEAITIILRLLGYSSNELGNNYPSSSLKKAQELSLTDGMSFSYTDYIDRKSIALLIDKALMTDMYSTSSRKTKLIESLNYSVSDECVVLSTKNENKELHADEVVTSTGTYKKLNDSVDSYVTQTCKLILDKDRKIVSVIPINKDSKTYIVQNVAGNEISCDKGIVQMDYSALVYFKDKRAAFSSVSDSIKTGTKMIVYYTADGTYDYAVFTEYELSGPVIFNDISDISSLQVNTDGLSVIRDGKGSSLSSIQKFDVLYYDKYSNILYAYCDKVTGIYEEAYPNKTNVTSIKISGVKYSLETQNAVKALNDSSKSYKINDYVTALLGKDGKVVAVVNTDSENEVLNYGVLLSCSEKIEEGTKNYYAKFLSATGLEQEFKVTMNYDLYRGKVAEYHYEAGFMMPFFVTETKITGVVDKENRKIGDYWLSKDCRIVDLSYAPGRMYEFGDVDETIDLFDKYKEDDHEELDKYPDASARVIEISEITAPTIYADDVVDAQLDENGNVAFLVLNDITMSRYKYGVVTKTEKSSNSSTYKIDFGGTVNSYSIDGAPRPVEGDAVMASIQENQLQEVRALEEVKTSGDFEKIDKQKVKIGSVYYSLAKDTVVFQKSGDGDIFDKDDIYNVVSIEDMKDYKVSRIHIYLDKPFNNGGRIRVIVFTSGNNH